MGTVPQPAIILQHRSSPVPRLEPPPLHDPREQAILLPDNTPSDRAVIRSQAATIAELQQALRDLAKKPQADDPLVVLDAQAALERIAAVIGWKRTAIIVRNLALIEGETV